jgi:hypothetical protein
MLVLSSGYAFGTALPRVINMLKILSWEFPAWFASRVGALAESWEKEEFGCRRTP